MAKKFKIIYLDPNVLIPYELNAKNHSERQISDLAKAILKRGFDQPITVDKDMVIITGHGRREAAIFAGLESVPVIVRDDLSESEIRAKRLEDNKLSSTDYDATILQKELADLVGNEEIVFGFDESELKIFTESMIEMDTSSFIDDLNAESERRDHEHEEISDSIAREEPKATDVLGFKTLPSGTSAQITDFMALCEERTGKQGAEAFAIYTRYICEQEQAKIDAMSEEELLDYLNSKVE